MILGPLRKIKLFQNLSLCGKNPPRFTQSLVFRLTSALSLGVLIYLAIIVFSLLYAVAITRFSFPVFNTSLSTGSNYFSPSSQKFFTLLNIGLTKGAALLTTGFLQIVFESAIGGLRISVFALPVAVIVLCLVLFISSRLLEKIFPSRSLKEKIVLSLLSSSVAISLITFSVFIYEPNTLRNPLFFLINIAVLFSVDFLGRHRLTLPEFIRDALVFLTLFISLGLIVMIVQIAPSYTDPYAMFYTMLIYAVPLSVIFTSYAGGVGFVYTDLSVYEKTYYFWSHIALVPIVFLFLFIIALRLAAKRKPRTKKQTLLYIWRMPTAVFCASFIVSYFGTAGFSVSPVIPIQHFSATVSIGINSAVFSIVMMLLAYFTQILAIYAAPFVARRISIVYKIASFGIRKKRVISRKQLKRALKGV